MSFLGLAGGCETQSFFDPSEMGAYATTPKIVQILKNLDTSIEEPDERFANAVEVRPGDLVARATDYVIGRNDMLQVSIGDLVATNADTVKVSRVSESGFISLPMIGQVKAAGQTEAQLEQSIQQAYKDAQLLTQAQVSVVTVEARNRTFTISGAINRAGQYQILESNFRLLDAMVTAGEPNSLTGIEYVYVIRQLEQEREGPADMSPTRANPATQPTPDVLTPRSQAPRPPASPTYLQASQTPPPGAPAGAEGQTVIIDGQPMRIQDGRMVPAGATVVVQPPTAPIEAPPTTMPDGFAFNDLKEPDDVRVIRVPYEPLKRGELKYNIVIRPRDFIIVPQPAVGEYYMGGHVARTGVYSLTARNISLKQAIISAGMLDGLAIPQRTQITRRIGPYKEVIARIDLAKIFAGEEPDVMLKPEDQVMVGTNAIAPFLAAFRSGFRITYGFGFLYDKNFSDDDFDGN